MERSEILALMGELRLFGMRAAFDEIITTAVKRQHEPQRIVADLLQAEVNEKHARSIRYQLGIAKLPLAKDVEEFQFTATPINETLIRDLAGGEFLAHQRNLVLVGGTGTGKTHLAIAIGDVPGRGVTPPWGTWSVGRRPKRSVPPRRAAFCRFPGRVGLRTRPQPRNRP